MSSSRAGLRSLRRTLRRARRQYLSALPKLIRLSRQDLADLLRAQWALLKAQLLVWTRPQGRLTEPVHGSKPLAPNPDRDLDEARRLALAVNRAAAFGVFRPLCLVRAVALGRMLEARGIHGGAIRVGVRMVDGKFAAHAWVEYGEHVLGDTQAHVESFAQLPSLQVLHRR